MKKIIKKLDNLLYEYGCFAVAIIVAALVTLVLVTSEIITPVINYLMWGIE